MELLSKFKINYDSKNKVDHRLLHSDWHSSLTLALIHHPVYAKSHMVHLVTVRKTYRYLVVSLAVQYAQRNLMYSVNLCSYQMLFCISELRQAKPEQSWMCLYPPDGMWYEAKILKVQKG